MMDDLTPLSQPMNSQVTVDPTPKECPSDGFNYPIFRQLNKQARVYLSQRFNLSPSILYLSFAIANSKGWFAAVQSSPSGSNILFSTLEDLRLAFTVAKEDTEALFSPKRILPITLANVNIVAFASSDTRLVVGLENGSVAIYDTALLFTAGTDEVSPLKVIQLQSSLRQILPNPGTDPNLSDLLAIVGDGKVLLLNMDLETQGGWSASDLMTQPISVSWSPKGRHIGIGLQTGDILTFSLTNKSTPNKHIPPTADAILVSLHWLGPGHTFRTTYAAQDNSPAKQHIITLDVKSSTVTYVAPDHPFPAYDRTQQNPYLLSFPKWDEDHASNDESKSLTVVADFSSVDIEVLGSVGNKWFRQSQDNPLTLPLDKSMEDTVLLSLVADLTDTTAGAPIVYAYLNDGSLQGWHAEHSKPYIGVLSPGASISVVPQTQTQDTETKDTEMVSDSTTSSSAPVATAFNQPVSPFRQQPTTFGQTVFGQAQTPAFSQPSFGQTGFGQASFGPSSQNDNHKTHEFASLKPATGFSAFATTGTGAFPSFGSFGSSASASHTFGPGNLSNAVPAKSSSDALSPNISPTITQEASMSDSTAGFGELTLGTTSSDTKPANSMFGAFGAPTPTSDQAGASGSFGSGGPVKPATGFGVFGAFKTSGAFDPNNKPPSTVNAFASPVSQTQTSSGFGRTGFGEPAFGSTGFGSNSSRTAFGQPAFGQSSFGTTPASATMVPTSGGFSAFANAPTSVTTALATKQPVVQDSKPAGFAAFASGTRTPFGSTTPAPATTILGASTSKQPLGFGSTTPISSLDGFNSTSKAFGAFASSSPTTFTSVLDSKPEPSNLATPVATRISVFGTPLESSTTTPAFSKDAVTSTTPKETPTKPITISPPSSPEPRPATPEVLPKPVAGSTFTNTQTTPSSFQPAVGFGAFGSSTPKDSPFFKKPEQTTPSSPFIPTSSGATIFSSSSTPTSTFGSTSVLGPSKSAFGSTPPTSPTPVKSTATPTLVGSAFSAFSGSSNPLAAVASKKKSFSDLLKTGGDEGKDPEKPSVSLLQTKSEKVKAESDEVKPQVIRSSVFGTPTKGEKKFASHLDNDSAISGDKGKGKFDSLDVLAEGTGREESFGNISVSSASSSFFEVEIPKKDEEGLEHSSDQDDRSDFLTDEDLSEEESGSDEGSLPEEGEVVKSPTTSPTAVPLPLSRSASATPQPEVKIQVSDVSSSSIQEPSSREESTTPPGTPLKEIKPIAPNGAPSTPSLLGIGLGRPSTRPTRRSPLANTVVLAEDRSQQEVAADSKPSEEATTPTENERTKTSPVVPTSTKGSDTLPTPPSGIQSPPLDALMKKPAVPVPSSMFSSNQRPATIPPASSLFGQAVDKSTSTLTLRATTPPTNQPSPHQGLFGAPPMIVSVPNFFGPPSFTLGKTTPHTPTSAGTLPVPSASSASTLLPKAPQGMVPAFGTPSKQLPTFVASSASSLPQIPKAQEKEIVEEGMQKECINLVKTVEKEIEGLAKTAANARHVLATLNVSLGGSKNKIDLGNPARWGLADLKLFGHILLQYENELELLSTNREKENQVIGEIKSNILKAGTRREEIARFNRAKDDKEFAKILKARTLGPEHSETQTQLRKSVRAIRDRVEKLEKRLQEDKKTLAEAQSCKPRIKAPSLDTINRTYRNIAIAIEQETDDINRLTTRISKVNIADVDASSLSLSPLVQRDARLPDNLNSRRPINVTPHVAVTTAAALNAERSAQKLKRALLAVRKEPLLNTKAAASPIAPLAFNSPAKAESDIKSGDLKGFEVLKGPLFLEDVAQSSELGVNDWNLPEDHFDPSGSHVNLGGSNSSRRDKSKRSHRGGTVTVVKKNPVVEGSTKPDASGTPTVSHPSTSTAAPVSFDWGPLPAFASPTPLKTLPISFVPISPPVTNSSGETKTPKPLEPQKNIPKGFVAFSTFSPSPATGSLPLSAPSSNGNGLGEFTFAQPSTSQSFSFSKIPSKPSL